MKASHTPKDNDDVFAALITTIRDSLEENLGTESAAKIKQAFAEIDTDRSNTLSPAELSKAMKALRVTLTHAELDMIISRFDSTGSGEIDYREFMRLAGYAPGLDSPRPAPASPASPLQISPATHHSCCDGEGSDSCIRILLYSCCAKV